MSETEYDAIVQGAGMVGLALALALAKSGLRLAVVEAQPIRRWSGGESDLRVSAVTAASERILRALEVWETISAARTGVFRTVEVFDSASRAELRFDAAEIGESHLGHIVENSLIQTALFDRLKSFSGVNLLIPGAVQAADAEPNRIMVRLEDGRRLGASVLVGADGASSRVRELAAIGINRSAYEQQGLVATVEVDKAHGEVARQRFLPGGPLAFLPLRDGRCSIVWSLPSGDAERLLALADEAFLVELNDAAGDIAGRVRACGPRAAFPLFRLHAERYSAPRIALVGDAAHVIHPLAGQGFNLGLLDAAVLAECMDDAQQRGRDVGGQSVLRRYERWRKADNVLMQRAMDGFHYLFTSLQPVVVHARGLGLSMTGRTPFLKSAFMRQAMGIGRDLPRLAC